MKGGLSRGSSASGPHLLFFVTEDWYFCSHRLPLALAALEAGYRVSLVARVSRHAELIRSHGIRLIPIELDRQGTNPLADLRLIFRLYRIYRRERPDIIHQVAMKPVLYGSLTARLARIPGVVNALGGMGFLFSSQTSKARLLRPLVKRALHLLLSGRHTQVILQNPDDLKLLCDGAGLDAGRAHLIRGAGVDLDHYRPVAEPPEPPIVMLPSRLLWDKGVAEFVAAARELKARGTAARFVLVGDPDPGNPAAVPEARINEWVAAGTVEWWGHRDNMAETLGSSHIVCLPSYREGLPKVLLEAAACGRPLVSTDAPGCREVARDGDNGLLVPVRDSAALAQALERLIDDAPLRAQYGKRSRQIAEEEFGIERVAQETLEVYRQALT